MTDKEIITVLTKYIQGEQVAFRYKNNGNLSTSSKWEPVEDPIWNFTKCDYKIIDKNNSNDAFYISSILNAHMLGKEIYVRPIENVLSANYTPWKKTKNPNWNFEKYEFRIGPQKDISKEIENVKGMIEIVHAHMNGKKIERKNYVTYRDGTDVTWTVCSDDELYNFGAVTYRVKPPRPKVQPYDDAKQFMKDKKEHGSMVKRITNDNASDVATHYYQIVSFSTIGTDNPKMYEVAILGIGSNVQVTQFVTDMQWLADNFVWEDDAPFGKCTK